MASPGVPFYFKGRTTDWVIANVLLPYDLNTKQANPTTQKVVIFPPSPRSFSLSPRLLSRPRPFRHAACMNACIAGAVLVLASSACGLLQQCKHASELLRSVAISGLAPSRPLTGYHDVNDAALAPHNRLGVTGIGNVRIHQARPHTVAHRGETATQTFLVSCFCFPLLQCNNLMVWIFFDRTAAVWFAVPAAARAPPLPTQERSEMLAEAAGGMRGGRGGPRRRGGVLSGRTGG